MLYTWKFPDNLITKNPPMYISAPEPSESVEYIWCSTMGILKVYIYIYIYNIHDYSIGRVLILHRLWLCWLLRGAGHVMSGAGRLAGWQAGTGGPPDNPEWETWTLTDYLRIYIARNRFLPPMKLCIKTRYYLSPKHNLLPPLHWIGTAGLVA